MCRLLMATLKGDLGITEKFNTQHSKAPQAHVDQITELAATMRKATKKEPPHWVK